MSRLTSNDFDNERDKFTPGNNSEINVLKGENKPDRKEFF